MKYIVAAIETDAIHTTPIICFAWFSVKLFFEILGKNDIIKRNTAVER